MASIARRPDGTYRPRFRDETGKEHARHFKRKVDAQRWLDEQTAAMVTGAYVDPRAGRMTFAEYAEQWRATQVVRPTTGLAYERVLRRNVYPRLGTRPLASIRPSEIQGLVAWLSTDADGRPALAPRTVRVTLSVTSAVFKSGCPGSPAGLQPVRRRPAAGDPQEPGAATADVVGGRPPRCHATALAGGGRARGRHRRPPGRAARAHRRPHRFPASADGGRPAADQPARTGAAAGTREDAGVRAHGPVAADRGRRSRRALGGVPGGVDRPGVRRRRRAPDDAIGVVGIGVASSCEGRRTGLLGDVPRPAPLLREPAHPARRIGQDGAGPPRALIGRTDTRRVLPSLA